MGGTAGGWGGREGGEREGEGSQAYALAEVWAVGLRVLLRAHASPKQDTCEPKHGNTKP